MSTPPPELSPADHTALAPLLTALTAPATPSELDGIAPTLVALRAARVTSVTSRPFTPSRRRPSMITTLAGAKLGATIAGIAVGLGGAATVVYVSANVPLSGTHATASPTTVPAASTTDATGTADPTETETPEATETPDATKTPDATETPDATATAVGPDATGPAAHGLCTAWRAITSHSNGQGKAMDSIAFANLAKAAGGADQIAAYCATVAAPGASGTHATGKPSAARGRSATAPKGKPQSAPTKPQSAPTGKPTTLPTPTSHPTGRH